MDVRITMLPQPGPAERNPSTGRFLVQSAVVTSDELIVEKMWAQFSKNRIQEIFLVTTWMQNARRT